MPKANAESLLGYGIFFDKGYELIYKRYGDYNENMYPDKATRLASSRVVFDYAYKKYKDKILDNARKKDKLNMYAGYFFGWPALSHFGLYPLTCTQNRQRRKTAVYASHDAFGSI